MRDAFAVVDSMMVREFTPTGWKDFFGGVLVLDTFTVRDVGLAESRLPYDTDRVDCSRRMFHITTWMMIEPDAPPELWCFPSRRWRNLREGENIIGYPSAETPLLYIGNPIRVWRDDDGINVMQQHSEFLIKTGVELGY